MKLKKKIILVLSMTIMTLSTVLSSMQVHASTNYNYVSFSDKKYEFYYKEICTIVIRENGQIANDSDDGVSYFHPDSQTHNVEVVANIPVPINYMTTNGSGSISFSSNTTAIIWDLIGEVYWDWTQSLPSNSLDFDMVMSLMDLNLNIYGQSIDIPFNSNTGLNDGSKSVKVDINSYIFIPDIPENKTLSYKDVEIEARFLLSFSLEDYTASVCTITPRWRYAFNGLKFYELYGEELATLKSIFDSLNDISDLTDEGFSEVVEVLMQIYDISLDIESDLGMVRTYVNWLHGHVVSIDDVVQDLRDILSQMSEQEQDVVNGFKQDSDSQSSQLNNLNQQSQPDKIDVDNASGVVDQNLNINTDANYGVLLSTFTSNGKILTMLLAVSSIGLISYVLFGKR